MQFKHLLLISLESAPEVVVVPIVERVVYDDATGSGALPAKPSVSRRGMSASQRASPSFVNDLAPGQRRRRWTRRAELRRGRSCGGRAGAWPPQIDAESHKKWFQNGTAYDEINVGCFDHAKMVSTPIGGSPTQRLGTSFCNILGQFWVPFSSILLHPHIHLPDTHQ